MKGLNGTIRVRYIDCNYFLSVMDSTGKELYDGSMYDSEIRKAFCDLDEHEIASVDWFISKANESYVFDVNMGSVAIGENWAIDFWMEGGWLEDWSNCFSLGSENVKIKELKKEALAKN